MNIDEIGRIPPQNIEAEQCVLGSILLDSSITSDIVSIIKADDFYRDDHKKIYEVIFDLFNKNKPIDIITVSEILDQESTLNNIGGLEYLTKITSLVPTVTNAKHYAKIVQDKSIRRQLIKKSLEISNKAWEQEYDNIIDLRSDALQQISDIDIDGSSRSKTNKEILDRIKEKIKKDRNGQKDKGLYTDIPDYDKLSAGLHNQEVTIIAGRPGNGKTALGMQIGMNVAGKKKHVLFVSREMSDEQVINRTLSHKGKINSQKIRCPELLTEEDMLNIEKASTYVENIPFEVNETIDNIQELRSYCRYLKNKNQLDLLIVDYIQLMNTLKKTRNRTEEVGDVSRQLKIMSKEFNIPVIVLAQLNRSLEREEREPKLSDLRECGDIEQDADNVVFIYTPLDVDISAELQQRKIIFAKQRNGSLGYFDMLWEGKTFTFYSMTKDYQNKNPKL